MEIITFKKLISKKYFTFRHKSSYYFPSTAIEHGFRKKLFPNNITLNVIKEMFQWYAWIYSRS